MSSAISSAKNRRANQPAVIPPSKTVENTRQINPATQPGNLVPNQSAGLSLQQVIEIYGRRLNQLETFMNKTQSQQLDTGIQPKNYQGNTGPSLAQIQDLIDAKIRDYNDLMHNELQPLREGLESSRDVVSEADFSEFHSRCQMLAEEIFQIKDIVLKLQSFTMSVNEKLLKKTGVLNDNSVEPEGGLTIPISNLEGNIKGVEGDCEDNEDV